MVCGFSHVFFIFAISIGFLCFYYHSQPVFSFLMNDAIFKIYLVLWTLVLEIFFLSFTSCFFLFCFSLDYKINILLVSYVFPYGFSLCQVNVSMIIHFLFFFGNHVTLGLSGLLGEWSYTVS